jgi:hypothetical protein
METGNKKSNYILILLVIILLQNTILIYKLFIDKSFEKIPSKDINLDKNPENPEEIFELFKKSILSKDFESLKKVIHSEGVYYFNNERIPKAKVNYSTLNKNNCFNMLSVSIQKGEPSFGDNFMSAMGGAVSHQDNPHQDFQNWQENGGYFKPGSKIISVDFNPNGESIQQDGSESLIIELSKDNGVWKIFSIYKWVWSIE